MAASQEQQSEPPSLGAKDSNYLPGSERSLRRVFTVAAIVVGSCFGAIAILINWYVGQLLP
jgi:hypothetical protein